MNEQKPPAPPSPCIRQCCLDPEDVCLGCGRTITEICAWQNLTPQQQWEVVEQAAERLHKRSPHR